MKPIENVEFSLDGKKWEQLHEGQEMDAGCQIRCTNGYFRVETEENVFEGKNIVIKRGE